MSTSSLVSAAPATEKRLRSVMGEIVRITTAVQERFEAFDRASKCFWHDVNIDSFRGLQGVIAEQHRTTGTVLCGLVVKLGLWRERFPGGAGGPQKRLEFIDSEILPGLHLIQQAEQRAAA